MAVLSSIPDVIVIGGSYAGLSTALTLCRATHTSLIFDDDTARNRIARHAHMTPTWDHKDPNELRKACREELEATGLVKFVSRKVVLARRDGDLFEVVDSEGQSWKGKKIMLGLGVVEKHPDIEGFTENYGTNIFHCLFCDGYEKRGASRAAVLAQGRLEDINISTIYVADARKFAKDVKIYTNGNPKFAAQLAEAEQAKGIEIDDRKLTKIVKVGDDIEVSFDDGPSDTLAFLAHPPEAEVDRTIPDQLGCEVQPYMGIKVTMPWYATTAPGVFAAGDCCSGLKSVLMSQSMGSCAGVGIARELPGHLHD
jgi:thioredoxin reductase